MGNGTDSLLRILVGRPLTAVMFLQGYVQLGFDQPWLSLYVWPQVTVDDEVRSVDDPGYTDALCALIGYTVRSVAESTDAGLVLDFGLGCSVVIKPKPAEVVGPEIAMLQDHSPRHEWMVWRPGESPFDGPEWS
jgi:hypothetical protein